MSASKLQFLKFVIAAVALVGVASVQASGQVNRRSRARSGRPARVSRTARANNAPTAALRAFYQAAVDEDFMTAMKSLSARSLRLLREGSGPMSKTLEEAFRDNVRRDPPVMPEFGNERVTGATATVDVMSEGGQTFTMPMVRENAVWKVELSRLRREVPPQAAPAPPAAEGDYSEDEKHRLFQAVGIAGDNALIIEVAQKIGIVDARGQEKSNFQPFIEEHYRWAAKNAEFIQQHLSKDKAREYVMAHK